MLLSTVQLYDIVTLLSDKVRTEELKVNVLPTTLKTQVGGSTTEPGT